MLPDRICRLLTASVDGELEPPQRQELVRWLRRSSEARLLLRALQNDADQLRDLPRRTLGPDFSQQVLEAIAHRQAKSSRRSAFALASSVLHRSGWAAAAAVFLALGLGAYFYFAAHRPQQSEPLAARNLEPDSSQVVTAAVEPQAPTPPLIRPNVRERLGPPAPEMDRMADSVPARPPAKEWKPPADTKQRILTSPVGNQMPALKDPAEPSRLVFDFRELAQEQPRQQLHQALQRRDSHRIELRCSDTRVGIEQLRAAFQAQGIQFIIDQDAQAVLKLGMGADTPFAVYCENITAPQVVRVLERLGKEKQKGFDHRLVVSAMAEDGQRKLSHLLGFTLTAPESAAPHAGKPEATADDRQALVVVYTPGRARPISADLKRFLDGRKARRAHTIRLLLVLSSPES
jgi:hypothetical protein